MSLKSYAAVSAAIIFSTFSFSPFQTSADEKPPQGTVGNASWYGSQFHGRRTANGERFNMDELTAAHRTLPFGSKVRVTNQATNDSVVVRINDRGPHAGNRVIDLSRAAAKALRLIESGVAPVKLEILRSAG
jgi:rare lipoprotein A